jgi:zinc transporter ZupT
MQNPSRFSLAKRLLFPYSGEDLLTLKQGLRVVLAWTLLFSLPVSLGVLALTLLAGYSSQEIITSVVFTFLSGAFIFGMLSVLIVVMSNRAAHIRQAWKAQNGRS